MVAARSNPESLPVEVEVYTSERGDEAIVIEIDTLFLPRGSKRPVRIYLNNGMIFDQIID